MDSFEGRSELLRREFPTEFTEMETIDLFLPRRVIERTRLLGGVNTETTEEKREATKPGPGPLKPEKEIPIHRKMKRGIDPSHLFPDRAAPKTSLLGNHIKKAKTFRVVRGKQPAPHLLPFGIDHDPMAIDDIDLRMFGEIAGNGIERTGKEEIVRIKPAHDIAAHLLKTPPQSIGLPAIGLGNGVGEPLLVLSDDSCRPIGRTSVDHRVAEIRIALVEDALDRRRKKGSLLVGRRD